MGQAAAALLAVCANALRRSAQEDPAHEMQKGSAAGSVQRRNAQIPLTEVAAFTISASASASVCGLFFVLH